MRPPPKAPYEHLNIEDLKKECDILSIPTDNLDLRYFEKRENEDDPPMTEHQFLLKRFLTGALSIAIHRGDANRVDKLLETNKIDLEGVAGPSEHGLGYTPLAMAALHGDVGLVRRIVERGGRVNGSTLWGFTAIMSACRNGHVEVVEALLELGADVNAVEKSKYTPLAYACKNGTEDVVLKLLEAGADKSCRIANGETPLLIAARWGRTGALLLLIEAGANHAARNERGESVFHLAAKNGHAETLGLLRHKKCDASFADCRGYTALIVAAERGSVPCVDHILRCKTGYNSRNHQSEKGWTALHMAARHGHTNVVLTLLKGNATVGLRNKFGDTPLSLAAEKGHDSVVRALMEYGAQPHRKITVGGRHGLSAITIAAAAGKKNTVRILLSEIKLRERPKIEVPYYLLAKKMPWDEREPWKDGKVISW